MKSRLLTMLIVAFSTGLFAKNPIESPITPFTSPDMVTLQPEADHAEYRLTVTGPDGFVHQETFDGGHVPFFEIYDLEGKVLADGYYNFQLTGIPHVGEAVKAAMLNARETGDRSLLQAMRTKGQLPEGFVFSGGFRVHFGAIVMPDQLEMTFEASDGRDGGSLPGNPIVTPEVDNGDSGDVDADDPADRAQVIAQDLVVQGSTCVGQDCVNGESFGFDTLRLKENNLRIKFQDTSNSASFPTRDWQITANDSTNGGANKFSIDDIDGGRTPFTIEAGAPSHSLYVDDGGRIGVGTSTPVVEIHVINGDSPTLRLEQDGSSGFTPQTWDVASNETNFFVRDATNGSPLPFRIRPSAPQNSLYIDTDGDIGLGTASPSASLDISAFDDALIEVTNTTSTQANRTLLKLVNTGGVGIQMLNNSANSGNGAVWNIIAQGDDSLTFNTNSSGGTEVTFTEDGVIESKSRIYQGSAVNGSKDWTIGLNAMDQLEINNTDNGGVEITFSATGDITANGVTLDSDVNLKENFEEVSTQDILNGVLDLNITRWNFINNQDDVPHLGPMAQDFYAAFGLGASDTGISTTDANGVALASIQALHNLIAEKDARIETLEARVAEMDVLKKRLAEIEAKLLED